MNDEFMTRDAPGRPYHASSGLNVRTADLLAARKSRLQFEVRCLREEIQARQEVVRLERDIAQLEEEKQRLQKELDEEACNAIR